MPSKGKRPNPRYSCCHDMNRRGSRAYEPTGPGEIALGAFKLALNNSDANWIGVIDERLIHEVGSCSSTAQSSSLPMAEGGEP